MLTKRSVPSLLLSCLFALPALGQDPAPKPDAKPEPKKQDAPKKDVDAKKGDAKKGDAKKGDAKKGGDKQPDPAADKKARREEALKKREERLKKRREMQRQKQMKKRGLDPSRVLDPDCAEAQSLQDMLKVRPNYAKDGTVQLIYTFREPDEIGDWKKSGFGVAEEVGGKGRRRGRRWRKARRLNKGKTNSLALGVSSRGKGLLIHKLDLKGEWTVTVNLWVDRMTPRSQLVLFCGKAGVRWGNQLVSRSKTRFTRTNRKVKPDRAPFDRGQKVVVKLEAKDGLVSAWVNGSKVATTKKLKKKVDGAVGLFATNLLLFVQRIEIKGKVDKKKL